MIKTENNFRKKQLFKAIGIFVLLLLMGNQAMAQTVPGPTVNVTKGSNTVKVVDNKGTIKYFQSNNGITQITNTTADKTTTTWQLGGTLTDNTYIDATGAAFALDGLAYTALTAQIAEPGTAVTKGGVNGGVAGVGTTGYALLVRNEVTGATEKLLASSLVTGGVFEEILTVDAAAGVFVTGDITGLTTVSNKISVFRNGIKLRQTGTADWARAGITIDFTADAGEFYADDVIEVQWVN